MEFKYFKSCAENFLKEKKERKSNRSVADIYGIIIFEKRNLQQNVYVKLTQKTNLKTHSTQAKVLPFIAYLLLARVFFQKDKNILIMDVVQKSQY